MGDHLDGGVELTSPKSPVFSRVLSLTPTRVAANKEDRYRIDERRNVIAEIRAHPITGLGLGVPWTARYPLGIAFPDGRRYVHFTLLWWWLNLGLLGALAYLALLLVPLVMTYRVWRSPAPSVLRLPALTVFAGVVGLSLAETTGAFTGVDQRFSIGMGCLLGIVGSVYLAARPWLAGVPRPEPGGTETQPDDAPDRSEFGVIVAPSARISSADGSV